jgi:dipeptidyl aminopeptidase/acylaminoacyl peptidase
MKHSWGLFYLLLSFSMPSLADDEPRVVLPAKLVLDEIMAGNAFIGHQPGDIVWSPGSDAIYFRWNHENEPVAPYYVYSLAEKKYRKLTGNEQLLLPVDGFTANNNSAPFFFRKGNNLYKWGLKEQQLLYGRQGRYSLVKIIGSDQLIIREGDNLFLFNIATAQYKQLTNFVKGNKPAEVADPDFLEAQQDELFEIVKTRKTRTNVSRAFSDEHAPKQLRPVYLEGKTLSWLSINDQLTQLVYCLDKYAEDAPTYVEEHITADGYTRRIEARPKVGSEDPVHEIWVQDLQSDSTFKLAYDHLDGIGKKPAFLSEYPANNTGEQVFRPKKVIPLSHGFNMAGDRCIIELKSYDNKDRWLVYYQSGQAQTIEIDHQHDEAWIGGPGISSWKSEPGNIGWINDQEMYYQSEETGYAHLYQRNLGAPGAGGFEKTQLTDGNFEIHAAQLSKDKSKFFITANKNHPGNREFYVYERATGKMIPILTGNGNHEIYVSPDEKWLAVRYSSKTKPWELYIAPLKENTTMTQVTFSTTDQFNSYPWRSPEVITFPAQDGTTIYARIYEPAADKDNGAGVIFVHGAGYLQNAHNWWSHYHREYMFNNLLADLGYTVMDIDYRASEGYGRDFRTGIYRHMGGKDLSDHMDGRNVMIEKYGCDANRMGIYGGSYGGFITLMAMLTEPGKFKCGAALRSVTDWAHYNHEYTANILNTPEEDPDAYKRSSPIYFAEGLQGRLLMLHGMIDDNVHYQDVVRLSQRFIELKKTNWDLIGYPAEQHAFVETTSWIDEYRRILDLFEEELNSEDKN